MTSETYTPDHLKSMATAVRFLAADMVQKAKSGHPGMSLGMADVATVLFSQFMRISPQHPSWPDRDRFVLSAGHGSALLYALSHVLGYEGMTTEQLQNFRQRGYHTAGHPEHNVSLGIETTTGPLGQGLANAVGMALAERHLNARFGDDLVSHYTYVMASDGDLMEGITHEASSLAGHWGLGRLIVLYDDNAISIDGDTNLSFSEDIPTRYESYGWDVQSVDGHDMAAVADAITKAQKQTKRPSLIACKTTIGHGAPTKAGTAATHGSPLGDDEMTAMRKAMDWQHAPFEVPDTIIKLWRDISDCGLEVYDSWAQRFANASEADQLAFERAMTGDIPQKALKALSELTHEKAITRSAQATRKSSGSALAAMAPHWPELLGGSADLTPSNNTYVGGMEIFNRDDYAGRYIHYGVREHGMAAIMNGMALHGGVVPYAGTFLTFSDYCRPAIRLAALMKQRVVFVMTHDSIGLGEDGPTHQPIEHLAALRAIPNLQVLRPADAVETAEAWEIALTTRDAPTVLALSRQSVAAVRTSAQVTEGQNKAAKGAYVVRESDADYADCTLIASGSEVTLALETAAELLDIHGLTSRIVSVPWREAFLKQDRAYQGKVLGEAPRFVIEAGTPLGWNGFVGRDGLFFGVNDFGLSAPAKDVYDAFDLTPPKIAKRIAAHLEEL